MASDSRQRTLQGILKWSLGQQDDQQPQSVAPMDPEVRVRVCMCVNKH